MKTAKERDVKSPPTLPPPPPHQIEDVHNDLGWLGARPEPARRRAEQNLEALGFAMREDEQAPEPPKPPPLPDPPPQEPDHDQRGPRPERRPYRVPSEESRQKD